MCFLSFPCAIPGTALGTIQLPVGVLPSGSNYQSPLVLQLQPLDGLALSCNSKNSKEVVIVRKSVGSTPHRLFPRCIFLGAGEKKEPDFFDYINRCDIQTQS